MAATRCSSCNTLCSANATSCKKCGAAIAKVVEVEDAPATASPVARVCPHCAEKTTKETRCEHCGSLLPKHGDGKKRRCPDCAEETAKKVCEHCGYEFGVLTAERRASVADRQTREGLASLFEGGIAGDIIADKIRGPSQSQEYFARRARRKPS